MDSVLDNIVDALKKSLDFSLVWRYGLVLIASIITFILLAALVFLPVPFFYLSKFSGPISELASNPQAISALEAMLMQNIVPILGVFFVSIIFFILLTNLAGAFFEAGFLCIARDFFSKKTVSITQALSDGKKFVTTIFKAKLLIAVNLFALYLILMVPAIFVGLSALSSIPSFATLANVDSFFYSQLGFAEQLQSIFNWIYQLISLLVAPMLLLVTPIIIFEKKTAMHSIKRAIELAKNNYLKNLFFVFVLWVIALVTGLIFALISIIFLLLIGFVISLIGGIVAAIAICILLGLLLAISFFSWLTTFNYLATIKYYNYTVSSMK